MALMLVTETLWVQSIDSHINISSAGETPLMVLLGHNCQLELTRFLIDSAVDVTAVSNLGIH